MVDWRHMAEQLAAQECHPDSGERSLVEHELRVHQIQLELQNEELRSTQVLLEQARDRYRDLFDHAPVAYLAIDVQSRIVEANLAFAALLGIERGRLVGQRLPRFMSPDDADRFHFHRLDVLNTDHERASVHSASLTLRRPDGTSVPVMLESIRSWESDVPLVRTAVIELRDRHRVESESRDREVRLGAILDSVDEGILTVDPRLVIMSANAAAQRMFRSRELAGNPFVTLWPEPDRKHERQLLLEQLSHGRFALARGRRDRQARSAEGRLFPVEVSSSPLPVGDSSLLMVVVRDITERERAQADLVATHARLQLIAEHTSDAFYIGEAPSGHVTWASPALSHILGRSPAGAGTETETWLESVHPSDRERVQAARARARRGEACDVEYRIVQPGGAIRLLRDRMVPVPEHREVIGTVQDITDERRHADDLEQANRMEAMGTLASGIAHDFNNLLMALGGMSRLALRHLPSDHPAAAWVQRGLDALDRGVNLTRQLLTFVGKRRGGTGHVEVDEEVRACAAIIERLVGDHIRLQVETGVGRALVAADPGDLEQLLINLSTNARDAMPDGGELRVRTQRVDTDDGTEVELLVQDTGKGMDAATRARIFEPFFTTKEVGHGTGLGLSTVFSMVRRLRGRIDVQTEPGKGTAFAIRLPLAGTVEGEAGQGRPAPPQDEGQRPLTVLAVDDDPLVRTTVQTYLESLGHHALVAEGPHEALAVATSHQGPIDVLLTDVMMPRRFGGELARELVARSPTMRVLYMSAHPAEELVRLGRIRPGVPLLSKPFDERSLGARLIALVNSPLPTAAEKSGPTMLPPPGVPPAGVPPAPRDPEAHPSRVLVIDDNLDTAEVLREALQLDGHEVAVAHQAKAAVRVARSFHPDVVLCDLDLGEQMNGFDVAKAIRALEELRQTRIVAVTGATGAAMRADARAAGFDDLVTKPIDWSDMERLVRAR